MTADAPHGTPQAPDDPTAIRFLFDLYYGDLSAALTLATTSRWAGQLLVDRTGGPALAALVPASTADAVADDATWSTDRTRV